MADFHAHVVVSDTTVPVISGNRPSFLNLDNAASTPPFEQTLTAINEFAPWYSSVHRGGGFKSRLSTYAYEACRRIVGEFFGADPKDYVVIFGKNTTEALNKLAYRLPLRKTDIVLISHMEHHSNDLPWRARATVKRIGVTADGRVDRHHFLSLLEKYAGRVRLVSISGASNVTGYMPDIYWFARKAHAAGAQIAVDCAQLAAHRRIRVGTLSDPAHLDYIACSAHKMYAPFGTGVLVGRRDTFTRGEPEYRGGGTVTLVTSQQVDWAAPPDCEEAGTPNVLGAVALAQSLRVLETIGMDRVAAHEADLLAYALEGMRAVPGITLYGDTDPTRLDDRLGIISFSLAAMPVQLVAAILYYEWDIGVRSGCFCAHPYVMTLLNLDSKERHRVRYDLLHQRRDRLPGMVRVSFGLYNTRQDVDRLVEALRALANGQHAAYELDIATGMYTPVGLREDFTHYFTL